TSTPGRLGVAGRAFVLAGDMSDGMATLKRLEALAPDTWMRANGLVAVYSAMGDSAKTIAALGQAAAGDGDQLPGYAWATAYSFPTGPRAAAVWKRYNLDPAKFARPIARR